MQYGVVLFENTQAAVHAEQVAEENGFEIKLVPVPRELSKNCGIAMRFKWEDGEDLRKLLTDSAIKISELHKT